jgi:GNAT superfamily N-acetyltransferase
LQAKLIGWKKPKMDEKFQIQLSDDSDLEAVRAVRAGLDAYNLAYVPLDTYQPLNLFVRGPEGTVLGGLLGGTYWGWLYISYFWLDESLRRKGLGSQILLTAEDEAGRRGCRHVYLETIDFQALPFYQKKGYTLFGVMDDKPPGHKSFFLRKDLPS